MDISRQYPETMIEEERWSGGSLTPSTGYSALFTSGLLRTHSHASLTPPRPIRTFSSHTPPRSLLPRASATPRLSPRKAHPVSPKKNPTRRLPSSPSKLRPAQSADKALSDVMSKLRVYATNISPSKPTSSPLKQSRWSSSSDESMGTSGHSHKPRKSGESTRSRVTVGTLKSKKSTWSLKSRRSEDGDRPTTEEERPPMPEWRGVPVIPNVGNVPVTPGRGRRVVEGLARRLGLTPKKKYLQSTPSKPILSETYPQFLSPAPPPPLPTRALPSQPIIKTQLDPNLPRLIERPLPRKSSLSTLRSLAKKTSTGTLRSVKSIYTSNTSTPDLPIPPFTSSSVMSMSPVTPRRPVVKKSSMGPIGQPKSFRVDSPTIFDSLPRRAPKTPEGEPKAGRGEDGDMEVDEIITFASPSFPFPNNRISPETPITSTSHIQITPPSNTLPSESPNLSTPRQIQREMEMEVDFNFHEFLTSTPLSQRPSLSPEMESPSTYRGTPPLTIKAQSAMGIKGKSRSKSRLMDLLPSYNRYLQGGSISPPTASSRKCQESKKGKTNENEVENRGIEKAGKENSKMFIKKSFSNASTPGLKNGLPIPLPQPSTKTKQLGLVGRLRLGSSTTPLTRNPLSTIPLPQSNTSTSYTYRSGAVSRAGDTSKVVYMDDETIEREEDRLMARPATSMGHNRITFPFPNPLPTTTNKSVRRRRVPDFSRPMSAQDLSFDTTLNSNVSVHHYFNSSSSPDRTIEVDPLDIHTGPSPSPPLLPSVSPTSPTSPILHLTNPDPISTTTPLNDPNRIYPILGRSNSGGTSHERMNSNSSLMTAETGHTANTGTSGISGTSGWELERYLRDVESDIEDDGGVERMEIDHDVRGRRGGVIQQAKYGIRI